MIANEAKLLLFLAAVSLPAVLASGCAAAHRRAAIPWGTAVLVRPIIPEPVAGSGPDEPLAVAEIEIPAPNETLVVAPAVPARPRIFTSSVNPSGVSEKPDVPQFVPELSPQQSSSFQHETEQSLSAAERNLASVSGKSLNPGQADLLSKIRSFVADAREAARTGDWARARDLSRKARVLSDQLVESL